MKSRAPSDGTNAIAGAIAAQSDVIANGCAECGLSSAELAIWSTPTLVQDEAEAQTVVSAKPPTFSLSAHGTYRQPVPPGTYLFCATECVAVTVTLGMVTTVNIMQVFGPTSYRVFEAAASMWQTPVPFKVMR